MKFSQLTTILRRLTALFILIAVNLYFISACPITLTFNTTDAICPNTDGGARVIVGGGSGMYTFQWMPGGATTDTIGMLTPGTYVVTVVDTVGLCMATDSVIILGDTVFATASSDTICIGNGTTLYSNGPPMGAYIWSGGDITGSISADSLMVSPNTTQTYTLDWFNGPGCNRTATITITVVDLQLTIIPSDPTCSMNNGSIAVTAVVGGTGPYLYTFQSGATVLQTGLSNTISNLSPGNFLVTVTDQASGCSAFAPVVLTDNSNPVITDIIYTNPTRCCDDTTSVVIVVSGGSGSYNFSWAHDAALTDSIATGLFSGTSYNVQVFDGTCAPPILIDSSFLIPGPSSCVTVTVDTTSDNCNMGIGTATVNVSGGVGPYTYLWSTGATSSMITGLTAGGYTVVVRDSLMCAVVASAQINDPGGPSIDTALITCDGFGFGDMQIIASGLEPLTYIWSHDTITTSFDTNLSAGNYIVQVYDSTGCAGQPDTFAILPFNQGILDLGPDTSIVFGQQISLQASTTENNWQSFTWSPNHNIIPFTLNAFVRPDSTTTYILTTVNPDGCLTIDSITVFVDEEELKVVLPNLFTPNNDGLNDFFFFIEGADKVNNIEMLIFDRWGNKVIELRDPNFMWNGTDQNGATLNPGVYFYFLRYESFFDPSKELHLAGDITLIR